MDVTVGSVWRSHDKSARPQRCKVLGFAVRADTSHFLPDRLDGMRFAVVQEVIIEAAGDVPGKRFAVALPCFGAQGRNGYTRDLTMLDAQQSGAFVELLKKSSVLQEHHVGCDVLDIDPAIGRATKPCNCGATKMIPLT